MTLKEYIKQLTREVLDEESGTGAIGVGAGPIMTPYAFSKGKGKNAATKTAEKQGFKVTKGETEMPGDSKIKDYVSLTGKKKKKVKIYKESNYDAKSTYGQESGFTKASPSSNPSLYLQKSEYTSESMDENTKFKIGDKVTYENQEWEIENIFKDQYRLKSSKGLPSTNVLKSIVDRENKKQSINESLENIIKEELLNEVTYHKFKNEVKFRTKNEQLHKAIREVKRKLSEIDRIVEYTSRMKQELSEGEEGIKYWKATSKNVATISEMVNQLNNKIKNLQ
jgi:hypothetical protein